ncbi:ABC transporter permease [Caviibacter abscessus]|uniref:ABC transporter permease n=1 Tax=Caviibacter abscessus TaxID=1766719 RepID=UPI0008331EB4|nr:ABC transporter permease [Caviibacter abscessus]
MNNNEEKKQEISNEIPTGFNVIKREFQKDKVALFSLALLVALILIIFITAALLDKEAVTKVEILDSYARPGEGFLLGADSGGRPIFGQLIIGARNSILIGFSVTCIAQFIGISIGLVAGYYGGKIDSYIMRIIDFIMILPITMVIIVFITIVPKYTVPKFIFILSAFAWVGSARLVRSKALSESRRDYIQASKTLGTRDFVIIVKELLPNISSIILVNLTLTFAGNIGIETGLTYLGYGLPLSTPSLGTLISYASKPEVISSKPWVWIPASILILILMLCINYVGQALKRATNVKQRLG